ncbi:GNAT family N-acetyltransferase [Beduini massiliensis]|uniref:GNAT family N-acetyltransferase n=1 Tax=Beduini massiliensis TaxID=1585974 RepID=UPI00059A9F07|nr:GNAT family N-acetyltransferase [Beduini massiliensis]
MEERIHLRKITADDLDHLYALYHDEKIAKYMRHGKHESIEETKKLLALYLKNENYAYAMMHKENGEFIGYISLTLVDAQKCSYTLTIMSYEKYWNGGYSSEALKMLIETAAALPVKEIVSYIYKENIGSCKVMEKCGFTLHFMIDEESDQPVCVYHYLF